MSILAIIAVIALGGYAYGFIKTRELSALRKEMKLYVDRMEAAELDLHAIRSVAEHRLHGAGKQFADLYSRIDGATGGRLRERAKSYAKALANDILR